MGSKETPMGSKRTSRRELLKGGATLAGGLTLGVPVHAQTHDQHDHASGPASGSENASPMLAGNKEIVAYGERSHFVTSVRIQHPMGKSPDEFGKLFHVASPIQDQLGNITPSSLHYIATTRQAFQPDIDPKQHTLMIHGLVDRPLTFTMDDLRRFPSVSRLHFLECAGNRHTPRHKTVQESHGMTSCSEWTGVLLSTLLKECGLKGSAKWFVAQGAEEVKGASSMPIGKAMDDCIIAYGQNGEPLRPQQGFPLRIVVPGFEGIFNTKWLSQIKVVDRYYMNYSDFGHLKEGDDETALGVQIGPKSVITYPSGTQQLPGKGTYEISGLAWSGGGAIKTVEVSTDGGKKWNPAELKMPPQRMAHVRFAYQWNWDGNETELLSRCTDEIGQQQPMLQQIAEFFKKPYGYVPGLNNSIMPWRIAKDGKVTNGLA
jgi:sulfane dehydrogenase subunit SoxC